MLLMQARRTHVPHARQTHVALHICQHYDAVLRHGQRVQHQSCMQQPRGAIVSFVCVPYLAVAEPLSLCIGMA